MFTSKQFTAKLHTLKTNAAKFRDDVQECLIAATYFACKDGNVEPFNQILDAVGSGTRIAGITKWAEINAPAMIKKGKFVLNKTAAKEYQVENEADFEPLEADLRKAPTWYDIVEAEKVESIWDSEAEYTKLAALLDSRVKKADNEDPVLADIIRKAVFALRLAHSEVLGTVETN